MVTDKQGLHFNCYEMHLLWWEINFWKCYFICNLGYWQLDKIKNLSTQHISNSILNSCYTKRCGGFSYLENTQFVIQLPENVCVPLTESGIDVICLKRITEYDEHCYCLPQGDSIGWNLTEWIFKWNYTYKSVLMLSSQPLFH